MGHNEAIEPCECESGPIPGVLLAMDTVWGIQRCDACGRFEGDLEAAAEVARVVGGEVWYIPSFDDAVRAAMRTAPDASGPDGLHGASSARRWDGEADARIASQTNPFVMLEGKPANWFVLEAMLGRERELLVTANVLAEHSLLSSTELADLADKVCC